MLDVHPPEHTPHSWRDFFIHIATIVIGLLIAIGLEQTVEAIHHHHQARHAREQLAEEMDENRKALDRDIYVFKMHQDYLFADLPVIERIRTHTLTPTDRIVVWHPHTAFTDASWRTIHESQAAALLSFDELQRYGEMYQMQSNITAEERDASQQLMEPASVVYRSAADRFDMDRAKKNAPAGAASGIYGDALAHAAFEEQAPNRDQLARLTPAEVDHLQQAVQKAIYLDDSLLAQCNLLQREYAALASNNKL